METLRQITRRLALDSGGSEIAEAAAVLPLMFMVLLGIFWFGQAFSIYGAITRAAQEGARAGAIPYCVTCSGNSSLNQLEINAASAVQNALQASRLDPTQAKYPAPAPALLSCGATPAPVPCSSSASSTVCIQAPIELTNGAGATNLCGISVSLRYPFRFWLPFTSINNQTIWISASARVRRENQ